MEFEFPYDRTGERNHLGRTKARFLETQDGEYLKAESVDNGVWAYKKGDFLEVEDESEEQVFVRGFFAVGADPFPVMRSRSARGLFTLMASPAPADPHFSQEFGYTGNGLGFRLTSEDLGLVRDIAGHYAHVFKWPYYWTDGASYELRTDPLVFGVGLGDNVVTFDGNLFATPGAIVGGTAYHAMAFDSRNPEDQRQHRIVFQRDSGAELFGSTIYEIENKIVRLIDMHRIGPQAYLVLTMGFIAITADPVFGTEWVPADTPLLEFHLSTDNGATWTNIGLPASMAAHMAIWREYYDTLNTENFGMQGLLRNTWVHTAHMPDGRVLASMLYLYFIHYGTEDQVLVMRVLKFFVDPATGVMTDIEHWDYEELEDTGAPDYVQNGFPFFERGLLATREGVLIMRTTGNSTNYKNVPFKIGMSIAGEEPETFYTMPFIAARTGRPTMLDARTIVCPMFDGQYSLYQSRNWGATWTKRATISQSTTPPTQDDTFSEMNSFSVLVYLRENGRAVNATPGTPWFSDDRIARP